MPLPTVQAVRYITPLREGGSLPILVEASDGRMYVLKLRGAGQGKLALVAEVLTGELARCLGLPVPQIALVELDPAFAVNEPDAEVQDLLRASAGLNVGLEFLTESTTFDLAAGDRASEREASLIVWLDAFTLNVDRTPRNPNLLRWRDQTWLIDHGASLYFHHNWRTLAGKASLPFAAIRDHMLLRFATRIGQASEMAHEALREEALDQIVAEVPESWLSTTEDTGTTVGTRGLYLSFLCDRLRSSHIFEQEIERARAL